jgi:hypothetical protein
MKYEFRPGDRVRFRKWDDMAAEFGENSDSGAIDIRPYFTLAMKHLCGTEATITAIDKSGYGTYSCTLTDFTANGRVEFYYCFEMLEPAVEKVTADKFLESIGAIKPHRRLSWVLRACQRLKTTFIGTGSI